MGALRYIGVGLVLVVAALGGVGLWLLGSEAVPTQSDYRIDVAELRRLASSLPGELPTAIRSELIAEGALPRALMMAGESFQPQKMTHVSFQVLYPDGRYVIIDSGYDQETHERMNAGQPYHAAAWERVQEALAGAWQVVITHEHPDHIGGIARHPDPGALAERVRLTTEQLENQEHLEATDFPATLREAIEPLAYERAMALTPGVVVQKAPGHTPGSQLVFVTLADGRELLFVGDVAWNLDALTRLEYRPRLVTDLVLGEDRAAVLAQFRALHDLVEQGEVFVVVSHDPRARRDYRMTQPFQLPSDLAHQNVQRLYRQSRHWLDQG